MKTRQQAIELCKQRRGMLIGEQWHVRGSSGMFDNIDPSTGEYFYSAPLGSPTDVQKAVAAAKLAFPAWRNFTPAARRELLNRFADLMQSRAEDFGAICALELGSPIMGATQLIALAAEWVRYYAGWCDKIEGTTQTAAPTPGFSYSRPEPYGIVAVILTWNFPLVSAVMKTIPALAAGNCVVTKMPELSPYAIMLFAELIQEAGFPPGVASFIGGRGDVGSALTKHPDIAKVSFTGGLRTAQLVTADSAAGVKPLVLELGGKSANIIFADADLDAAVPLSVAMSMIGAGQGCALPTRLFVARDIYAEVLVRIKAVAENLSTGSPFDAGTVIGPVMTESALQRILGEIERAKAAGEGRLIAGGGRVGGNHASGFYIQPTVFADVSNSSTLARDEIFGPVLSVIPFDSESDVVAMANDNNFGLAGYIQTRDLERAIRVADQLDAGYVSINGFGGLNPNLPFGGFKSSGYGKEGGKDGIDEFLRRKSVFVAMTNPAN